MSTPRTQQSPDEFHTILQAIQADFRYQQNLGWGQPRPGHPEGSIRHHLRDLEQNLTQLSPRLTERDCARLRILIHTHDTFKPQARESAAISDEDSHASLARRFLAEFCDDPDLLAMVQSHDVPFAIWRRIAAGKPADTARWVRLRESIVDWNLFVAFLMIDGCTPGKSREPLRWLLEELRPTMTCRWTAVDLIDDVPSA